jgi:hypothetical protein
MSTRVRVIVAAIIGIILLPVGMYALWAQHSGVLVPVKVIECHHAGRGQTCTGQWQDSSDSHFVGLVTANYPNVGDVTPMRIHGEKAYTTSPLMPALIIGVGTALLGGAGYAVLTARRRTAAVTQQNKESQ